MRLVDYGSAFESAEFTNSPIHEFTNYLHFDLDPFEGASWNQVLDAALIVREALEALELRPLAKTTGSRGIHIYVPIVRGPRQQQVWSFAKVLAIELAARHPALLTAEYRVARRPKRRVLVDYNQNAWGRTLASIYSVRPTASATVSTPVTWTEIARRIKTEDFRIDNVPARLARRGDLWKPLLQKRGRTDLSRFVCYPQPV